MNNDGERSNPFPGLRSFEEHEDHLFFGREQDLDELLRRLRTTRFLAVLGTSGSGKSSLVKSGLIPSLYAGFMSGGGSAWRIAMMRPGEDPFGRLAEALRPIVGAGESGDAELHRAIVDSTLRRGDLGLVKALREARLDPYDRVLVVVDQFEEFFRFRRSRKIRSSRDVTVAFVQLLLEATRQEQVPVYVVTTMRSDFIGKCIEVPGLTETLNRGQYLVPLMNREQRRAAILGPVAVGGGEISPRLLSRLLNDVGDDPDQLPIMQHALMRTWDAWEHDHERGEPLDLRHYEAIGSMKEALDRHAEETYAELGSERRHRIAERLFKSLTEKSPNALQGVRRPSRLEEICAVAGVELREAVAVVDVFRQPGRTFLMPPVGVELDAESVIDISHESLMRVWKRLIRWVDEETEAAAFYHRLSAAARHHEEGAGALWRDPELALGLLWRERHQPTAAWGERYDPDFDRTLAFFESSRREQERELAEKERERQRKLRLTRLVAMVLGVAAVLTLAFGVYALLLKGEADRQRVDAEEQRRIAEQERREADRQREQALGQRKEADRQREEADRQRDEAERQQEVAEQERQTALAARQVADEQREIAEGERSAALAARSAADLARQRAESSEQQAREQERRAQENRRQAVVAREEARRLRMLSVAQELAARAVLLEQEAQHELAALLALQADQLNRGFGGEPQAPDIHTALRVSLGRLRPPPVYRHSAPVRAMALGPGRRQVALGDEEGRVALLDLDDGERAVETLGTFSSPVRSLSLDQRGSRLAAGSLEGRLRVWDLARPEAPPQELAATARVTALALRPSDGLLAAAAGDGVRLWDLDRAPPVATPLGESAAEALAFGPGGDLLALGGVGGAATWRLDGETPAAGPSLVGACGRDVRALAFDPKGRLACGAGDGSITVVGAGGGASRLSGHVTAVTSLAFSGDGERLVSASTDGTVRVWELSDLGGSEPPRAVVLPGHQLWVWAAAFAAGGAEVVSAGADGTVRVWTVETSSLARQLCAAVSRDLEPEERDLYLPHDLEPQPSCPGLATAKDPEGDP